MAKDVTTHDATTNLSETFEAPKSSKLIVSLKWQGIVGATTEKYFFNQSNIDPVNADPVPSISGGISITNGSDTATFEVLSPAKKFQHLYDNVSISAGTIDINTKIIYSND